MATTEIHSESSSYRSQKATAAELSLYEKIDTIPAAISILANTFAAVFSGALRSKDQRPGSYFRYVALTAIRTLTRRTNVNQQHYLMPPTDDAYLVACKKRGFAPNSEVLEDGTRAHWIGSNKAEKLIINFHGGGYVVPAGAEMFEFMFQTVDVLKSKGKSAAVLFLSYDLAPRAVYPRQLQQASALLNHVLTNLEVSPSNIVLTGDSAGANLALALLSHISHPHPSTTVPIAPVKLTAPLRGTVLISPWVSFDTTTPCFASNLYKDCIDPTAVKQWSSAFMGCPWPHTEKLDYYNQAITAPESWWEGLQVEDLLIVAGEDECLIDGIREFEKKLKAGLEKSGNGPKIEFLVAKGEYHDQAVIDLQFGYKESQEGEQAKKIKGWISSKL